MQVIDFFKRLFQSKKKKIEVKERVTDLMNKKCVCSNPCNEYCSNAEKEKRHTRLIPKGFDIDEFINNANK